jgi:hypothetical protein
MAVKNQKSGVQSRPDGPEQTGESGGGPYPNPHGGKRKSHFKGGDSDQSYYGSSRTTDRNINATTKDS